MVISFNRQERYIALDVETTGLSPWKGHRVIEIGAIILEGGKVMEEFSSLIKAPRKIPASASRIHGITDEMVSGQPPPEEVFPALAAFIRDGILVAHNAPFDLSFLRHEFSRLGLALPNRHVCTLKISRTRFPHLHNHKLGTVYRHLAGTNSGKGAIKPQKHPSEEEACSGSRGDITVFPAEMRIVSPERGVERTLLLRKKTHCALADAYMVAAVWLAMERING